jgi:hypothetical protein
VVGHCAEKACHSHADEADSYCARFFYDRERGQFVVSTIKDEDGGRKMERRVTDEATPSSGLDVRFFAIVEDMV